MTTTLTVLPFLVAMLIAVAGMPTDVVQVSAWGMGHEHEQPWRRSALASLGAAARGWFGRLFTPRFALALGVLLALLAIQQAGLLDGHPGVLMAITPAAAAEPTLAEVKAAIDGSNRAFEEFKRDNNTRIEQLATKGVVDPLITQKLEKLNASIDAQSAINERFIALEAKNAREKLAGDTPVVEKRAAELKSFNLTLRSFAASMGRQAVELTEDAYTAYKAAFDVYLRRGRNGLSDAEFRAMSVGVDTEGGTLVTPDRTGKLVERLFETSPMRQYAGVQVISTDTLEGLADIDEASFGWVGETATRAESNTPQAPQPWRIPVHEAYSKPRATQKLLEDANIDVAAWLMKKVADKIGRGQNTGYVTGNGVGRPRGVASYTTAATADGSRAWGVFEHVASGTNGSFGADPNGINKFLSLIHKLKDAYLPNAAFYSNRLTLGAMRTLTDASSAGKYVFIPSFVAGMPDTFLGYPARKLQDMADYTTTDALAAAFGDMQETYQIVDRLGITVLVDPYSAKPYVEFYARARTGGDVLNFESMKFLKFGTS